jgi:hypothetical protein
MLNPTRIRRSVTSAFLAIVSATLAVVARPTPVHAQHALASASASIQPSNHWLDGLTAKHKQFFDNPSPNGGIALVHVFEYYETYNKAFGVKDADVNAVLTFYGGTTFFALTDAAWAKYQLGDFLQENDPATGKPALKNPWRSSPTILGMSLPSMSMEALQKRGATLILCNNALEIFSGLLAPGSIQDRLRGLKANIIPGISLVPGMVIAVEQAQRAGLTYHRQ